MKRVETCLRSSLSLPTMEPFELVSAFFSADEHPGSTVIAGSAVDQPPLTPHSHPLPLPRVLGLGASLESHVLALCAVLASRGDGTGIATPVPRPAFSAPQGNITVHARC